MPRGAKHAIKKHDRDHDVRDRVAKFKDTNWQDWAPCEMYGHHFYEGSCVDCSEVQQ
jgi:hypothetical protein